VKQDQIRQLNELKGNTGISRCCLRHHGCKAPPALACHHQLQQLDPRGDHRVRQWKLHSAIYIVNNDVLHVDDLDTDKRVKYIVVSKG
jgi:hypothetical protein